MKTFFIGIDVSKDWLDYGVCKDLNEGIEVKRVNNSIEGIGTLIKDCRKFKKDLWFCMEHTGNYGLLLAHLLEVAGLTFSMVPAIEIKNSLGLIRGKSDKADAKRIAIYAAKSHYKLQPCKMPGKDLLKLKSLFARRQQLVKRSTQLQNSCKSHKKLVEIIDYDYVISDIEEELSLIEGRIKKIEKEIKQVVKSSEDLKANYGKVLSVKGVGPIIATYMLVCTNNFSSFNDPRKFSSYAGIAPFEHNSGSSIRGKTKTSKFRNKTIKALLFNGARSARVHDKQLKLYYQKKLKEGKKGYMILNNIACKLIYRIFAVVKREEPYVHLAF